MGNKAKCKILTQRHACSRMNFLYQAANLMAHNNNTLAAYYGKLCRNVGTKSLMHMSPALKRTLCKRCSLPLLPGINTVLKLDEKQQPEEQINEKSEEQIEQPADLLEQHSKEQMEQQSQKQMEKLPKQLEEQQSKQQPEQSKPEQDLRAATSIGKRRQRHRRLRGKRNKAADTAAAAEAVAPILEEHARLHLKCSLCGHLKRFQVDTQNECWPERMEAIVQVVTLESQTNGEEKGAIKRVEER